MMILLRTCNKPRTISPYHSNALSFISSRATNNNVQELSSSLNINCRRRFHSTHTEDEGCQRLVNVPFFPIYYNDVYEVNLPPGHRFPMWKYRKVRESVQAKVGGLTDDAKSRLYCGKLVKEWIHLTAVDHVSYSYYLIWSYQDFRVSPLATREELLTTHDDQYVHRYLNGEMTESENRNIGFPWRYKNEYHLSG